MYKAFNTFIDDVFAWLIEMPFGHRVACLRDDIVFFVYLYQVLPGLPCPFRAVLAPSDLHRWQTPHPLPAQQHDISLMDLTPNRNSPTLKHLPPPVPSRGSATYTGWTRQDLTSSAWPTNLRRPPAPPVPIHSSPPQPLLPRVLQGV